MRRTLKKWAGKYTRFFGLSWLDIYNELCAKDMLDNIPFEKAVAEKNGLDWSDYENYIDECIVYDIYGYANEKGIELVDLTDDELRSIIYDETIHRYDCEMIEYKYSIENKHHDETEKFETLDEAREKLAECEEEDREEGTYEENYYRIIDLATGKEVE